MEVSCPFTYFFASITTTGDPFNLLSTHPRLTTDLLEVPKIPVGQYLYLYRDRNHKVTQPFLEVIHESDDLRPAWRSMVERSRVSREGTGGNKTVEAPSARVRVIDLLLSLMKSIKGKRESCGPKRCAVKPGCQTPAHPQSLCNSMVDRKRLFARGESHFQKDTKRHIEVQILISLTSSLGVCHHHQKEQNIN